MMEDTLEETEDDRKAWMDSCLPLFMRQPADARNESQFNHTTVVDTLDTEDGRKSWMRACLPAFMQPVVDIRNGNQLIALTVSFNKCEDGKYNCDIEIVNNGEASYNRRQPTALNHIGTLGYRSFNFTEYKRTCDTKGMSFRNIQPVGAGGVPWKFMHSLDHAGKQSWAQGSKRDFLFFYSLMDHEEREVPYAACDKLPGTHRPRLYYNTMNHMLGEHDNNPDMPKKQWSNYPVYFAQKDVMNTIIYNKLPVRGNCFYACKSCIQRKRIVRDPDPLIDLALWVVEAANRESSELDETSSLRSGNLHVARRYVSTSRSSEALTSTAV